MEVNTKNIVLFSQKREYIWSFLIGLCCGTPYILTASTLKAWFTNSNVSIVVIGWLSLVNISYLLKFIWGPFFDHFVPPGYKSIKGWAIIAHFSMGIMLYVLGHFDPLSQTKQTIFVACIVAFFGSCITLALDGYWVRFIKGKQINTFAGFTEVGYRLGKIITGGFTLILADHFSWYFVYTISSIIITLLGIVMCFAPHIDHVNDSEDLNYISTMKKSWYHIKQHGHWVLILFLILVKVNEALEHNLLPVFMLRFLALSLTNVGVITKVIGIIANLIGLAIALRLIQMLHYKHTLIIGLLIHASSALLYLWLCYTPLPNVPFIVLITLIDNISRGIITTTLFAFYASQVNENLSATQLSLFSLLTGTSGIFFAPIAGYIVDNFGWETLFFTSAIITIPSMALLTQLDRNLTIRIKPPSHAGFATENR